MSKANVTVTTRKLAPSVFALDIKGEINAFAENALMDAYTHATSSGAKDLILNFEALE